jgi:uncharacterized membrane protein YgdD (TMEM256/DUF423 family)
MHKKFLITGASLAALAVVLGAFGAHSLKKMVSPETLNVFETGVRYQMYHSLALIIAGILFERFRSKWTRFAGYGFIGGIVLFSGSLFALTIMKATDHAGLTGIGILTPIGGLFFIAGWIALVVAIGNRNHASMKPV